MRVVLGFLKEEHRNGFYKDVLGSQRKTFYEVCFGVPKGRA